MRLALGRDVRLEALAEVAVGARPALSASGPLVPVPPRAAVWLGVAYRFGSDAGKQARARPVEAEAPPPAAGARPAAPAPERAMVDGRVVAADGSPPSDPRVTVTAGGEPEAVVVAVGGDGRFTFNGKAGGELTIRAEAPGYEPATETVTPTGTSATPLTLTLRRKLPGGQIRGLIRSFKGVGLDAEVQIEPGDQTLRTKNGRFEADVAPGAYHVTITAPGFETQRRRVEVEQNGVTVLNADLRSAR